MTFFSWRSLALIAALAVTALAGLGSSAGPAEASRVALGAYLPDAAQNPREIDRYGQQVGRKPVIVSSYKQWDTEPFARGELRAVWKRGALPMITWEPWSYSGHRYPLRAIVRGRFDGYIRHSARAAAAWGRPVLLRFAHEMNGNWYPWGRGVDGNTPRIYKAAWRHVVRIFRRKGARNVRWVWTPYVDQGRLPFKRLYPGGGYVDWVGLDGFNWGSGWQSFAEIFGRSYHRLRRISSRPVLIGETGSKETGGNKARWVSRALNRQLPRFRRIRALVWFNASTNGADLRVDSSRSALSALRRAARDRRYGPGRRFLLTVSLRARRASPWAGSWGM